MNCFSTFSGSEKSGKMDPAWLAPVRAAALARFHELGFPTARDEEWRFTNVSAIEKTAFVLGSEAPMALSLSELPQHTLCESGCTQLVFLDGRYAERLSTIRQPERVYIANLSRAFRTDREALQNRLTRDRYWNDPFVALNTAFMVDGAFIRVPSGVIIEDPIHLLYLSTTRTPPIASTPRSLILVGNGSQVGIVESYAGLSKGRSFTNAVTDIAVGEQSVVDHYKLQLESEETFHIGSLKVRQERQSRYHSYSLAFGGALVRNNLHVELQGEGADCELNGLYVTKGRQHVDNHTVIDHASPHCTSRELYKGILDDSSSGVFDGKVVVRKQAQKTSARQANRNLLLSKSAAVNTIPRLEILADDVKCTHGATIGQLNEDELFYLRTRGVDREAARKLLTYAFAAEVLGAIRIKPIQRRIDRALLERLSRAS